MVRKKSKRTLITTSAVLIVLLVAIGTIALIRALNPKEADPYVQQETSSTSTSANESPSEPETQPQTVEPTVPTDTNASNDPKLDPATVGTIDISPMELTVSYVKGVGGFEYEVLRTPNGTRYVEFRSSSLAGTKCTNDVGAFASILVDPDSNESTTLTKTTTVDGTKYGLSLESSTCTNDADKLASYQKSFSDAFGLLKKMN